MSLACCPECVAWIIASCVFKVCTRVSLQCRRGESHDTCTRAKSRPFLTEASLPEGWKRTTTHNASWPLQQVMFQIARALCVVGCCLAALVPGHPPHNIYHPRAHHIEHAPRRYKVRCEEHLASRVLGFRGPGLRFGTYGQDYFLRSYSFLLPGRALQCTVYRGTG